MSEPITQERYEMVRDAFFSMCKRIRARGEYRTFRQMLEDEETRETALEWRRVVRGRQGRRYKKALRAATPGWADKEAIRAVYRECRARTRATGVPHHVDHVVPLHGALVCGLHVEYNLVIMPAAENLKKGSFYEGRNAVQVTWQRMDISDWPRPPSQRTGMTAEELDSGSWDITTEELEAESRHRKPDPL